VTKIVSDQSERALRRLAFSFRVEIEQKIANNNVFHKKTALSHRKRRPQRPQSHGDFQNMSQ